MCPVRRSSTTRRRARDRTTPNISSTASSRWWRCRDAAARRHPQDPRARVGADRDRPGRGVRLLRRAGVQGAARGGLRGGARQLQPGHDHDRPGVRHRHLRRAAAPGVGGAGHRAREARRAAAHPRRGHRAEPRPGAVGGRDARPPPRGADRRELRGDPARRGQAALPRDDGGRRPAGAALGGRHPDGRGRARARERRPTGDPQARFHDGRRGRRRGGHRVRVPREGGRGANGQPDRPGAGRGVGDRLGRIRARSDAGPQRQRGDRLLDRERRPDGRPHRRLGDGRAAADADRPPVPGAARPGAHRHPRGRGGDRRLEHPVRGQPGHRRDRGDRDEPARVALLGARLQGHRLPDREDRRAPRHGVRARGDRQRHNPPHARELRADHRLRGGEVAAVRVREVPRRRRPPRHAHAVGGGGDGDRAHLQAGVREGDALARARRGASGAGRRRGAARAARAAVARPLRAPDGGDAARRGRRRAESAHSHRPVVPRRDRGARAGQGPGGRPRAHLQVGRHVRGGVRGQRAGPDGPRHEIRRGDRRSVVILGAGPNRIGQGIEFDYCCVHAAMTVRESGRDAVMVNCNPETVSTDYDTSDRLYFEPLTLEDVLGVCEIEQPEGVIVQFGGQTPLKLAHGLEAAGVPLLGTPVERISGPSNASARGKRPNGSTASLTET
ncbi:MAG: hypothetical protein E6G29_04575 [Actinobacteria bacterium]|nr:MAG: hypothetical protein E6G29_04575 [Actinomycetota bacterium]